MGALQEGDADLSHVINIQDLGIMAGYHRKSQDTAGYDARTDYDRNGIINMADFGFLAGNYGKNCPQTVSANL